MLSKIALSLLMGVHLVCVAGENNSDNTEVLLTMKEAEEIIKKIQKDPHLQKRHDCLRCSYVEIFDPSVHSKKGLEEIIKCVNNTDDCEHPILVSDTSKKISRLNVLAYTDLYIEDEAQKSLQIITETENQYNNSKIREIVYRYIEQRASQTVLLFNYFHAYVAGKKNNFKN